MKPTALSQNRRRHRSGPNVSLFPFLAVLICTIGAPGPLVPGHCAAGTASGMQEAAAKSTQRQADWETQRPKWSAGESSN